MYSKAREWGIQPSEFWEMTMVEWLLEAHINWLASDDGVRWQKIQGWKEDAALTVEEWNRKYGITKSQS